MFEDEGGGIQERRERVGEEKGRTYANWLLDVKHVSEVRPGPLIPEISDVSERRARWTLVGSGNTYGVGPD